MILHSRILGSGEPMIILHGFLGMSDNWKTLGKRFSEVGYQVHLVDQRNHGRSFHDEEFSYEIMAEDLLAYCEANGLNSAILLGHSMGGKTAMQFAVNHPEKVKKLIVADIAPKYYPEHHEEILQALLSLDFEELSSRSEADTVLAERISDFGIRQFLMKNLYRKDPNTLALRINLPVLAEKVSEVGEPLPLGAIFRGAVLFLIGGRSGYVTPEDEVLISRHFPNYEIRKIRGAGHWLHAENPVEFYQNVMNFL